MKKLSWMMGGLTVAVSLVMFPVMLLILVAANLVAHLALLGLQLVTARLPQVCPPRRRVTRESFVSIQVPAYNEPPEVLGETLRALSRLRWSAYEVLVIDNNTQDEKVWRPIEALCRELGPRFRFFHVDRLIGAKAGALNHVRRFMDPRAEFIFVVDADYVVEPDALRRALGYFTDDNLALVQFPQDYRNIGRGNAGLALDFKHFFEGYMNMANHLGCVPATGTLSLFRVAAMRAVGGFDTQFITEDAEIGFRMNAAGFRTLYANEVIGRGLMPHDLESLKRQRWRWAFGNAQILRLNWRQLLFGRNLAWRQKLGCLIHLTAWFNFNLIPCAALILVGLLAFFHEMQPLDVYIVILSWFTLATFIVLRFGALFYSLHRAGHRLGEIWLAFFTHLGLGWIFSTSWLKCLFAPRAPFVRTNKFLAGNVTPFRRLVLVEFSFGVALLAACAMMIASDFDFVFSPLFVLLMGFSQLLVFWVAWQTRSTFNITSEMQEWKAAAPAREISGPRLESVPSAAPHAQLIERRRR
jgi:cellulose synthase/poly-beta-1,6-N-acetylglucosamine synthase-like glycosyltransferase